MKSKEISFSLRERWIGMLRLVPVCFFSVCALTACQDTEDTPVDKRTEPLTFSTYIGKKDSRAVVTGNSLSDGMKIGVTVVDAGDKTYQDIDYNNVCYTASTVDGKQVWTADKDIMLSGVEGTLYAYYPYNKDIDMQNISIDLLKDGQVDWLYAKKVEGLSNDNHVTQVKLHHALANMNISLVKGDFLGEGKISKVALTSGAVAMSATLNARTGELTNQQMVGQTLEYAVDEKLDDKPVSINVLFVPTETENTVTVEVTVDNRTYEIESPTVKTEQGISYNYTLIQHSTLLEFGAITVTPWAEKPQGTLDVDKVRKKQD